jgi:hypothetical protein
LKLVQAGSRRPPYPSPALGSAGDGLTTGEEIGAFAAFVAVAR